MKKKFKIIENKGFHITFKNGWTISVQFGAGNYCDNYKSGDYTNTPKESDTAEVWAWNDKKSYGQPKGYLTPEQVISFINKIRKKKGEKEK